jgi:FkbM family methyltransferase
MSAIPALFKAPARALLKKVPTSLLEKIEDAVQKQLGKGSGAWSTKDEARLIADFAKSLQINNVLAIDAGANVGNWSAELLKCLPTAKVFAFEPSQTAFDELEVRFSNDKRVTCIKIALGKENTTSFLYADKGGSGLGSLTKRRLHHFNIDFSHQEPVAIKTLDTWVKENSDHNFPNILKMDVEGHEYDLLLGATDTLRNIQIIQFEFGGSNIDTRTFFQDFWYFFKDLGFEIYRIAPSKPILINIYSERDEIFRATNYIAVRKNVNATI